MLVWALDDSRQFSKMRVRRYFILLSLSSVLCFVILAIFDSNLWAHVRFTHSQKTFQRYTKQIGDFLRQDSNVGLARDEFIKDSEQKLHDIQELVRKLVVRNASAYDDEDDESTEKVWDDNLERCTPQENIVFLKTHKTGSSTLTNIFNRFADLRELTVALPVAGFNRFRWPLPFHWTYVDLFLLDDNYANILCNHARYVRESMDAVMELDAKYITILRNPIQQFESMFDYMEFSKFFGLQNTTNPMRRFLRRPFQYIRNMTMKLQMFPESMHLIRNGQFFDLGLNPRSYDNRTLVLKEIEKIDREFSLVLIMEYFDESLVLLKREMCWDLEDIVYAKFNQRHRVKKEHIDNDLKRMVERWNGADVLLYRHFNNTFWNKIKSHGNAFYRDLEEFRAKNSQVQQDCISPVMAKEKAFRLTKEVTKLQLNPRVTSFDRYFCNKLLTDEVAYLKYFRFKYNPYFGYQQKLRSDRNLPQKPIPQVSRTPQFMSQRNFPQGFPQPQINSREPTFVSRPQQQRSFQPQQRQFQRQETFQPQNSRGHPNFINKPQFIDIPPRFPF